MLKYSIILFKTTIDSIRDNNKIERIKPREKKTIEEKVLKSSALMKLWAVVEAKITNPNAMYYKWSLRAFIDPHNIYMDRNIRQSNEKNAYELRMWCKEGIGEGKLFWL